jgi:hypothetical protein
MKTHPTNRASGFTLLETVIAIGVLAVLLTGFMVVFAPAADGIRKSINVQQADRMASALEQELVTPRVGEVPLSKTGFDKAFEWIRKSNTATDALFAYQYRGKVSSLRKDGTPEPERLFDGKTPGEDYVVVPMIRRRSDTNLAKDLEAIEGGLYLVKCTQLVFNAGQLKTGTPGTIIDPKGTAAAATPDAYPEAVIAFTGEFFLMPAKSAAYVNGPTFTKNFPTLKAPVFSRNLAVRR